MRDVAQLDGPVSEPCCCACTLTEMGQLNGGEPSLVSQHF